MAWFAVFLGAGGLILLGSIFITALATGVGEMAIGESGMKGETGDYIIGIAMMSALPTVTGLSSFLPGVVATHLYVYYALYIILLLIIAYGFQIDRITIRVESEEKENT